MSKLQVRVIQKLRNAKGELIGYTIVDEANHQSVMRVYKDKLKEMVKAGQCEVVNMTMTRDGRLIGAAKKVNQPLQRRRLTSGVKLARVFTSGKSIICGVENEEDKVKAGGASEYCLKGFKPNNRIEMWDKIESKCKAGYYDNIRVDATERVDLKSTEVVRTSFSKVRDKFMKLVEESGELPYVEVKKVMKETYNIVINSRCNEQILNMIMSLMVDALANNKIKVMTVINESHLKMITVKSLTGITDVRKAIKPIVKKC